MQTFDRLTILYVEDSEADAIWLTNKLSDTFGEYIEVIHCRSLSEAHRSGETDIALLDLNLEATIGVDTVKRFRAGLPHLPVVVLSQVDDPRVEAAVMAAGAHAYFRKGTFELRALVRSMEAAVIAYIHRERADLRRDEIKVHRGSLETLLGMTHHLEKRLKEIVPREDGDGDG